MHRVQRPPFHPPPTQQELAMARVLAGNPGAYCHLPNFDELRDTAWRALKCAQDARREADRLVTLRRVGGPGDAA